MKLKDIDKQISFCGQLMVNLIRDFNENKEKEAMFSWQCVANKTQMINDVMRLRRELMRLSKQLQKI